ncbi:MAG: sulfur carrier protein ThiS [Nitrospirae bacterium]|nr:MAG: sulfur carrier protein ThiS [Nitrospirota bacterium]
MQILVNGERREVAVGTTVGDLLRELEIRPDRVAVEVNLEVLDRQEFTHRGLREGDRVEIISFMGGGSEEFIQLNHWRRYGSTNESMILLQNRLQFLKRSRSCRTNG